VADNRREEQKLWLILFQIKAIRTRLNLLAIQYWLFVTVAVAIAGAALIFILAAMMSPLAFLVTAAIVVVAALAAMVRAARTAFRKGADPVGAAMLADERASLKGRLTTILALAEAPPQSSLWPYLLEDTYGLRQTFEPARIEPRWISRSILALAAVCLMVGGLAGALKYYASRPGIGLAPLPADITADLDDLEVLPADPAAKANARVYADAATIRRLEAKLANAKKGGLSKWMDKARTLAGNLQDQVTGHDPIPLPSIHLKSSQPPSNGPAPAPQVARSAPPGSADDQAGNNPASAPITSQSGTTANGNPIGSSPPPAVSIPGDQADQMAQNNPFAPPRPGMDPSPGGAPDRSGAAIGNGAGVGGGATHGSGSDSEHLFGPPSRQQLGSDSFKIAIDAEPSDETSIKGAPAYIPPKVRVPLNSNQFPDEPLARASVPPADQMTVKRVFER
jgi:hypothetical protein